MVVSKVKISTAKRSNHMRQKKSNPNKKQPVKPKTAPKESTKSTGSASKSTKIFGSVKSTKNALNKKNKKKKKSHSNQIQPVQPAIEDDEDIDELRQDIIEMLDEDDLSLLTNKKNQRKRKRNAVDDQQIADENEQDVLDNEYGQTKNTRTKTIDLLPIKSRDGQVITRMTEVEVKSDEEEEDGDDDEDGSADDEAAEELEDSDDDIVNNELLADSELKSGKAVTTADLLILREQEIARQKYRIGIICSGILEKPEEKMKNFRALFDLMDEKNAEGKPNLTTVRKIAIMSALEVFRDVLPEYRIGMVDLQKQTVKKSTIERVSFENDLLTLFKKYLQKLERSAEILTPKRDDKRKRTQERFRLGEMAVKCLCDLLLAHPYFNFGQNIAQLLVFQLNSRSVVAREMIHSCFMEIFKTDKKLDLTLYIIRRLNFLIKSKNNVVQVEVLTCLMALQIKNINLDADKEKELKQKKLEAHRSRLLSMSKREKKRKKKLAELDKEMNETKAEENKQTQHSKLTEITKALFTIYFRILKNDPNSKLLSATLEGLAEFAHVINLDFFSDLIEVLNNLMEHGNLGYREELHCVQTVFTILSGQGEILNIDPLRFYGHLYRNLLIVHAGRNHEDIVIILRTLHEVLIKRRKNVTHHRLVAFMKRLMTLSLQVLHNGSLGLLGVTKTVLQLTSTLDVVLDTDTSIGSGRFDPELDDPEYCNANCTALYEVAMLGRHYHPTVRKFAHNIAHGVPATGDRSLNPELGKLSPMDLFEQFNSSEMSFNPPIQPPNQAHTTKDAKGRHFYLDQTLEDFCIGSMKANLETDEFLDFYKDFVSTLITESKESVK